MGSYTAPYGSIEVNLIKNYLFGIIKKDDKEGICSFTCRSNKHLWCYHINKASLSTNYYFDVVN